MPRWSLIDLVLLLCVVATPQSFCAVLGDQTPPVVYLHTEYLPYKHTIERGLPYRLMREMPRQALLMTARDELGLATRDATLGETAPTDGEVVHLVLAERSDLNKNWFVKLFVYDPTAEDADPRDLWPTEPLWEKTYKWSSGGSNVYAPMSAVFAADAAQDMIVALEQAGLKKVEQQVGESGESETGDFDPDSFNIEAMEEKLLKVDFITQLGVVRATHEQMRLAGESPELLAILVRGYAHLSMLTQHHWNASSEAFAARAMCYAQRLVSASEESELALWNRAYMWAVIGTHHHALSDIKKIADREDSEGQTPPEWTKLLDPFLHFSRAKLLELADSNEQLKPWALRLHFQLTSAYRYASWLNSAGMNMAREVPTAYGVYAEMAHHGQQLGVVRAGAYYGPMALGRFAPASLDAVPNMPKSIRALLPTDPIKAGIARAVMTDPNPNDAFTPTASYVAKQLRTQSQKETTGGVSWSALAYLLEEEQFCQAANYLNVSTNATESSLAREVDSVLPFVKDHRYAAYIDSYRLNRSREWDEYQQLTNGIEIVDAHGAMSVMTYKLKGVKDADGNDIGIRGWRAAQRNYTLQGTIESTYVYSPDWKPKNLDHGRMLSRELRIIAPYCEVATRMAIQSTPDAKLKKLKKWEEKLIEDPMAYQELAKHYERLEDIESAIRCYEKSLESLPTFNTVSWLAALYFKQGDLEKWEQTFLDFLETEDLGLAHAQAHERLAWGLARRGLFERAKPHAVAAGNTWSAWGLRVASHICECLAEWEESEAWIREMSTSYPTSSAHHWYFWCRRTGRGDVDSARALAQRYFDNPNYPSNRNAAITRGVYHLLEGDYDSSLENYRKAAGYYSSFTPNFMQIQLARELGNKRIEQEALAAMQTHIDELGDKTDEVDRGAIDIFGVIKRQETTDEEIAHIDRQLRLMDTSNRCVFAYFFARELEAMGRSDDAIAYFRKSVRIPVSQSNYSTLSGARLAEKFGTSRKVDDVLVMDDLWQPSEEPTKDPEPAKNSSQTEESEPTDNQQPAADNASDES